VFFGASGESLSEHLRVQIAGRPRRYGSSRRLTTNTLAAPPFGRMARDLPDRCYTEAG
jgi:hypothetical protein